MHLFTLIGVGSYKPTDIRTLFAAVNVCGNLFKVQKHKPYFNGDIQDVQDETWQTGSWG